MTDLLPDDWAWLMVRGLSNGALSLQSVAHSGLNIRLDLSRNMMDWDQWRVEINRWHDDRSRGAPVSSSFVQRTGRVGQRMGGRLAASGQFGIRITTRTSRRRVWAMNQSVCARTRHEPQRVGWQPTTTETGEWS